LNAAWRLYQEDDDWGDEFWVGGLLLTWTKQIWLTPFRLGCRERAKGKSYPLKQREPTIPKTSQ
jgi:hypothetical protein